MMFRTVLFSFAAILAIPVSSAIAGGVFEMSGAAPASLDVRIEGRLVATRGGILSGCKKLSLSILEPSPPQSKTFAAVATHDVARGTYSLRFDFGRERESRCGWVMSSATLLVTDRASGASARVDVYPNLAKPRYVDLRRLSRAYLGASALYFDNISERAIQTLGLPDLYSGQDSRYGVDLEVR